MVDRLCACGRVITPSERVRRWGQQNGRDMNLWPAKCAACTLDATIDLFLEAEVTPVPTKPACATCGGDLGDKFYQAVPGKGDLCLPCHETWRKELLTQAAKKTGLGLSGWVLSLALREAAGMEAGS